MKPATRAALICAALYCSPLSAKPAAYFLWRSPHNDVPICAQISPGDEWIVMKGPFQDASCRKLGNPH